MSENAGQPKPDDASAADASAATDAAVDPITDAPTPDAADGSGAADNLSTDDIERLLAEASGGLDQAVNHPVSADAEPAPFQLDPLQDSPGELDRQSVDLLGDVELDLRIELGRTQMRLDEVLQLRSGSVVALDKLAGDPVDVFVNGRLIARGEVLVMNDNFCVRVTELVGV
ncbi:flagellar motor switch protein FliN [Crateriforma conspicua]|uniref:Flagellar motor switch protein FliN n=1 Tax=Crateriforma conspicua TaxID=2527996 RepID=A0A5C5Y537_9PLAN|nr:flagellar motor switch protein FliN [Crateriforma conspicua]QDV65415.1 Flagellar motor switch protein FliN [Crateriforma conspicua]TWT70807.1 Flagellar motor switch protein FliN [Crateriforma conspicua]